MKLTVEGLEKERDFYFGQKISFRCVVHDFASFTGNQYLYLLLLKSSRHNYYIITVFSCEGKLRDVEVMCQENEAEGGEIIRKVFTFCQECFFDIFILSPPRFWTFFTRQKMDLRFLKKRRVSHHLQRGRRNTSVPLLSRCSKLGTSSIYPPC